MRFFVLGALLTLGACGEGSFGGESGEGGSEGGGGGGGVVGGGGGGAGGGGGGGGGGGTVAGTDTATNSSCNTAHEQCGPGVSGCGGEGSTMLPGANCLACHNSGGGEASRWTAAGTIFTNADGGAPSSNAEILITDSKGNMISMTSNGAGNFYTTKAISFPINVDVTKGGNTVSMGTSVGTGGCNACHSCSGAAGGKLYQP